jgi:hypothetical protein
MTAKFTVNGNNTIVSFSQVAPTAKMQNIIEHAAHHFWDGGMGDHGTEFAPILFSNLTSQQKLEIVDQYLRRVLVDAARSYKIADASDTAINAAIIDAATNLNL